MGIFFERLQMQKRFFKAGKEDFGEVGMYSLRMKDSLVQEFLFLIFFRWLSRFYIDTKNIKNEVFL